MDMNFFRKGLAAVAFATIAMSPSAPASAAAVIRTETFDNRAIGQVLVGNIFGDFLSTSGAARVVEQPDGGGKALRLLVTAGEGFPSAELPNLYFDLRLARPLSMDVYGSDGLLRINLMDRFSVSPTSGANYDLTPYYGYADRGIAYAFSAGEYVIDNLRYIDVPEPSSWVMMVGGSGILGATLRRRKPKLASQPA